MTGLRRVRLSLSLSAGLLAVALGITGCTIPREEAPAPVETTASAPVTTPTTEKPAPDEQRALVASLMIVGVENYDDALAKLRQGVGGIFIPSWADTELLTTPGRDITALREAVGRPFSVSIDFEGGRVQRHEHIIGSRISPQEMAATMTPAEVEDYARDLGRSLRSHGITVDYAPVLDVDAGGLEIVGDRAFSRDPHEVGEYGAAFARGLADAGVLPVFKHFPGHGQASGDTHLELAVTPPLEEVLAHDLPPYATALPQAEAAVMVGHMVVPGLGDGTTPSSLDPAAYRMLRTGDYPGGLPFDGVACTDDLTGMRAITDSLTLPQAVVAAVKAGADQPLFSSGADLTAAIDALDAAVSAGEIPRERLDEAARRVERQLLLAGV